MGGLALAARLESSGRFLLLTKGLLDSDFNLDCASTCCAASMIQRMLRVVITP
jgi:hypothetical protein